MNIVQIVPGTGTHYCGACIRENALAREYIRQGHQVTVVPMYLPTMQSFPELEGNPMFFGGINVYLQQKFSFFRTTPRWLDSLLDLKPLLMFSSRFAGMTSPQDLGDLTISVLKGEEGNQRKELDRLVFWLKETVKPDVVCLSTVLLAGLAGEIKKQLGVPVVSSLQGEDEFLDYLPKDRRDKAWKVLSEKIADLDAIVAVSDYFRELMMDRLKVHTRVPAETIYNGIDHGEFSQATPDPDNPFIGYLARLTPDKGLHLLVEAFIILKRETRWKNLKLKIGGTIVREHHDYFDKQRKILNRNCDKDDFILMLNVKDEEKSAFFNDLSVFSVPVIYGEAFGLYVLESLASGVPVVQPDHAAFPEIMNLTGGGVLFPSENPNALAEKINELLLDPGKALRFGQAGRESVMQRFSVQLMASNMLECLSRVIDSHDTTNSSPKLTEVV